MTSEPYREFKLVPVSLWGVVVVVLLLLSVFILTGCGDSPPSTGEVEIEEVAVEEEAVAEEEAEAAMQAHDDEGNLIELEEEVAEPEDIEEE